MKKTTILTWVLFTVFGLSPLAWADVLNMPQPSEPAAPTASEPAAPVANEPAPAASESAPSPAGDTITETTSQTVPGRGMHMDQVEARFGAPKEKIPAVGNPPFSHDDDAV